MLSPVSLLIWVADLERSPGVWLRVAMCSAVAIGFADSELLECPDLSCQVLLLGKQPEKANVLKLAGEHEHRHSRNPPWARYLLSCFVDHIVVKPLLHALHSYHSFVRE